MTRTVRFVGVGEPVAQGSLLASASGFVARRRSGRIGWGRGGHVGAVEATPKLTALVPQAVRTAVDMSAEQRGSANASSGGFGWLQWVHSVERRNV